ncbi:hypothetical protein IQ07DRAFT_583302 [Pyrenochaeta sp. DS3sAY3a]|nr:hypothetical protein IQ07DRAFT_583302 [Pyrenochaeta sp. DS3sAY3a]
MEPPAKRLRILKSVEVDEENPDYVIAKRQQQEKFKGRLESIFAKFENMHESMSDEIDMRENKVVVDRGHLRRLVRQVNRKETTLLDNLGMAAGERMDDVSGDEEEGDNSEDELAPTQLPKSKKRRREETTTEHSIGLQEDGAQTFEDHRHVQDKQLSPATAAQDDAPALPAPDTAPDTATNLLQFVQFPQTPAGQQAQASFYTTLAQTINQAVQQAVAPLFAGKFPNVPNAPPSFPSPVPAPATPTTTSDKVAPATDPKWYFPPLSAQPRRVPVSRSSPIPAPKTASPAQSEHEKVKLLNTPTHAERPQVKPRGRLRKYNFSEDDDMYISESRMIHKRTWAQVKDGKKEWSSWPLYAFTERWSRGLRQKALHLSRNLDVVSETGTHHLPTPSSIEHEENSREVPESDIEHDNTLPTSSVHFDDDDRDLLSMDGTEADNDQPFPVNDDEEEVCAASEDFIMPSIELIEFVDEDTLHQHMLDDLAMDEPIAQAPSSSASKPKCKPAPIRYEVPNSTAEDDELLSENVEIPTTPSIKREFSTPPRSSFLTTASFQTPRSQNIATLPSSGSKSTSHLDRKAYLKQVKKSWSSKKAIATPKSLAKQRSFQTLPVKRPWAAADESDDELAM